MKRLSGYPAWFYWLLLLSCGVIVVSGVLLIPAALEFKLQWEVDWGIESAQRVGVASAHLLFAWLVLMQMGALWHAHMRAGWRRHLNRKSGLITALALCVLALSGTGLYYFGSEAGQLYSSVVHTITGILFALLLVLHIINGRRIRRVAVRHGSSSHSS